MVRIEEGHAYGRNSVKGPPKLLVVSIFDEHPPNAKSSNGQYEWDKGTSLKAFFQLMLTSDINLAACVAAWYRMRGSLPNGYASVQDYYARHASPTVVYDGVYLRNPDGTACFTLLVHAPDFNRVEVNRGISLLVAAYRAVRTACTQMGGASESARMAPLSAGVFKGSHLSRIIAVCASELLHNQVSVPLTVYGYSAQEYELLYAAFTARGARVLRSGQFNAPVPSSTLSMTGQSRFSAATGKVVTGNRTRAPTVGGGRGLAVRRK
jgi:hypothetical protein